VAAPRDWTEIIPHRLNAALERVEGFARHLVVIERVDGLKRLRIIRADSWDEHSATFDEPAYTFFEERNEEYDAAVFRFSYSSLTTPRSVYDYNMETRERTLLKRYAVLADSIRRTM